MQTLWSRIAQVRASGGACRCPQCISSASGIARRSGATATRRAPKYLTSSTLWYSGIFAAAATFDAGVKIQRREKWDKAIAEVRQELYREERVGFGMDEEALDAVGHEVLSEYQLESAFEKLGYEAMAEYEVEEAPIDLEGALEISNDDLAPASRAADLEPLGLEDEVFSAVEPTFREQKWPTNTGTRLIRHNLAPESIYAQRQHRDATDTRHWTRKKVEVIALCIEKMQVKIMMNLCHRGLSEEAAAAVPNEYGKHILRPMEEFQQRLGVLRHDLRSVILSPPDGELENYERTETDFRLSACSRAFSETDTYSAPRELNLGLQRLIKAHRHDRMSAPQLLARICHQLSTSEVPPNLDTFNTLLLGLSRIEEHNAVYAVIRALHYANLRPNEVTISAILDAHAASNRPDRFVQFVEKMRGKYGGLALARPGISITDACEGRLIVQDDDPDKIIQLPHPTPKVFASLIAGVMKFGGFETALNMCKNMGEEGWGLCMSGLNPLLQDCVDRADMHSGLGVWNHVKLLEAKALRTAENVRTAERIPVPVFASMLRLCLVSQDRGLYDEVWQHATRSHRHRVRELSTMVRKLGEISTAGVDGSAAASIVPMNSSADSATLHTDAEGSVYDMLADSSSNMDSSGIHSTPKEHHQAAGMTATRAPVPKAAPTHPPLSMEHLNGTMYSQDLEDYEYAERPMTMHG